MKILHIKHIMLAFILLNIAMITSVFAQNHQGCYAYLTEIVRSSNFPVRNGRKDKINLRIDDDQPTMITAQVVYDIIPQKDNPNSMISIGWIKYDIPHHILWNNSADLNEHPVKLSFHPKYAQQFDLCNKRKFKN